MGDPLSPRLLVVHVVAGLGQGELRMASEVWKNLGYLLAVIAPRGCYLFLRYLGLCVGCRGGCIVSHPLGPGLNCSSVLGFAVVT